MIRDDTDANMEKENLPNEQAPNLSKDAHTGSTSSSNGEVSEENASVEDCRFEEITDEEIEKMISDTKNRNTSATTKK